MITRPGFVTNSSSSCIVVWVANDNLDDEVPLSVIKAAEAAGIRIPEWLNSLKSGEDFRRVFAFCEDSERWGREFTANHIMDLSRKWSLYYGRGYLGCFGEDFISVETEDGGCMTIQGGDDMY